jgi:hypothetical protein
MCLDGRALYSNAQPWPALFIALQYMTRKNPPKSQHKTGGAKPPNLPSAARAQLRKHYFNRFRSGGKQK